MQLKYVLTKNYQPLHCFVGRHYSSRKRIAGDETQIGRKYFEL